MTRDIVGGSALWYAVLKGAPVDFIGVPFNVLVACAIGAFCSLSFGDKVNCRRRLWGLFVSSTLMGAAFTAISNGLLQHYTDLAMTDGLHAGMGAAVSFVTRFALPWIADVVKHGKWLSWLPWINKGNRND